MRFIVIAIAFAGCLIGDAAEDSHDDYNPEVVQNGRFAIDSVEPGQHIAAGIPIAQGVGQANAVPIYNVTTKVLAGDKLQLRAVVAVSRCNNTDTPPGHGAGSGDAGSPCETMTNRVQGGTHYTYNYAPTIEARAIWKPTGKPLVAWTGYHCNTAIHHCPIVLEADDLDVGKYTTGNVAVEVRAYADPGDSWMAGDIMELEGDCQNDDYGHCANHEITGDEQNTHTRQDATQGQLTIVHEPAAGMPHHDATETTLRTAMIGIFTGYYNKCNVQHPRPQVVMQRQIDPTKLHAGDILQAETTFAVQDDPANGTYNFNHYVGAWIILTNGPGDIYPTGPGSRWISPMTGKNCENDPCTKHMIGAVSVGSDLPATPMYISVLGEAIEQGPNTEGACTGPNPYVNAFIDVLGGAKHELHVTCFSTGTCTL
jgi:hypothetical protein